MKKMPKNNLHRRVAVATALLCVAVTAWYGIPADRTASARVFTVGYGMKQMKAGNVEFAESVFEGALSRNPDNCRARYGLLLSRTRHLGRLLNIFFRTNVAPPNQEETTFILTFPNTAADIDEAVDLVEELNCSMRVRKLQMAILPEAPYIGGELRGRLRVSEALLIGMVTDSMQYFTSIIPCTTFQNCPPPDEGDPPPLPPEKQSEFERGQRMMAALLTPRRNRRGIISWRDSNRDGTPSNGDELRINLFVPGTRERVIDLAGVELFFPPSP